MNRISLLTITAMLAAAPLAAQGRGKGNGGVPPGQRPPAGMCRIWIDGVPPGRQPAPTDCGTANANRPPNARIIYGDRSRDDGRVYNPNGGVYYPNGGGVYYPSRNYPNGGIYYPNSNDRNRRVVVINGRKCVQSTDNNGRVQTFCSDSKVGDSDRRYRTYDSNGSVYRQDDRSWAREKHKSKGKHHND